MAPMPEFYSRTGRKTYTSAKEHQRWNDLPYGRWTCADGRVVLFNRYYEPIWHRPGDGGDGEEGASAGEEWRRSEDRSVWVTQTEVWQPELRIPHRPHQARPA